MVLNVMNIPINRDEGMGDGADEKDDVSGGYQPEPARRHPPRASSDAAPGDSTAGVQGGGRRAKGTVPFARSNGFVTSCLSVPVTIVRRRRSSCISRGKPCNSCGISPRPPRAPYHILEVKGCDTTCKRRKLLWRLNAATALGATSRSSFAGLSASADRVRLPCARWTLPQA